MASSCLRAVVVVVSAIGLLVGVTRAQEPVFRSSVDHVLLDVVVTDKDERPVLGLTQADFEVRERDRVQTIDDFKYVSVMARAAPVDLTAADLPSRDIATNARHSDSSRALVAIIDEDLISAADIVPSQRILAKLLQGITPDDEAAVVYVRHSNYSQDFTNDVGQLVAAVNHLRNSLGFRGSRMAFRDLLVVINNARAVLDSAPQPRKFIVFVGETAPKMKPLPPPGWVDALEKLRRSGVPIYPIDPLALHRFWSPPQYAMPEGFDFLAEFTGGHAVLHEGDPVATAADLMAENGSYYLLGYYPSPFTRDGKFHPVTVSVNRPGVHVRARDGYWALDQPALTAAQGLNTALGAGLDNPGLPVELFAAPITPSAKGMRTIIITNVTYPEGTPATFDDELRVGLVAADPDAAIKAQQQLVVPIHHVGPTTGPVWVVIDAALDLPEQPLTLRVAVASKLQHATGTAHLKVDVPPIQHDGPELGGLIVSSTHAPGPPAFGWDGIRALVPFQPTTNRVFATSDDLRVFGRAFWKPSPRQDAGTEAVIRILDTETSRTEPLTGTPTGSDRVSAVLDSTVPLTGLSPGTHVLQVEVRRPGRPAAVRSVVFEIR